MYLSEYCHSSPLNPPAILTSPFTTNFANNHSSTAMNRDYDSSLICTNKAHTTTSSYYGDDQYPNVAQILSFLPAYSLPATLQGALQGALVSHEGSRGGDHRQSNV